MTNTYETLKQGLIDHMATVDLTALSLADLADYAAVLDKIRALNAFDSIAGLNAFAFPIKGPAPMKGGKKNG